MNAEKELGRLWEALQELIKPYAGKVEYGNLRSQISEWDDGDEGAITNIALVYETPGGSTDQINISFCHRRVRFVLIEDSVGEYETSSVSEVIDRIRPRVQNIPEKRQETPKSEIRRPLEGGSSPTGMFPQINRIMQSEFKGGTITHLELRDAMMYAVEYARGS